MESCTSATAKNTTEYINNYFGKPVTEKFHVREGDLFGKDVTSNLDTILTTIYTYDKNGNVKTKTRPDTVVITNTYDNLDRLTSTSMPGVDENNTPVVVATSTTYDWAGKVLTQTDANTHTTINTYDSRERLIKVTDAKTYTTAYYYDRAGRMIVEVAPNNYSPDKTLTQMSRTKYTYDLMDRVKTKGYTYLDPVNNQWVSFTAKAYHYDEKGNKIKELDALGYEAGTGASVDDKITSGYGTEDTYDPANRLTTILDPVSKERNLSFTTKYNYDGAGRKTKETNAKGVVTAYTYNDAGNLLTTKVNNQTTRVTTYDLADNPLIQTDGNGNDITYEYNAWNKIKKAVYPGDATIPDCNITYQYDVNGNLKKKVNSAGPVDLYTYDNQGRELSHTQKKADGTQSITTSLRYDKAGNKRFLVDGNNVTTENIYNEVNKLTSSKITVTNIKGVSDEQITSYGYDANGQQTTKTDWLGNTFTSVYDPLSRLIEKKDPLTKSIEKMDYNHNNVQVKSTDALGKVTQFTYDKNNRLLSTLDPLNHSKSQTYDEVGNVKTTTDGRSKVTTNNYNAFNQLASVVNAKNETTSYTYDLNGNRLTQKDGANHVTTFEYNVTNKLSNKIDHGGRTWIEPNYTYDSSKIEGYTYDPSKTESYTYDGAGNLATKLDRNGITTSYSYDVHGRLLRQSAGTQVITNTYDGNGNPLTVTDSTGTTTRTYDELNRTKSKSVPGVGTLTFLYDLTTGLPAGQVAETDTDPKGNVTTQVFDKAGRMVSVTAGGKKTTNTYYDNGSKQRVLYPDGSSENYTYYDDGMLYTLVNKKADQTVIDSYTYKYDAAHNQTSKVDGKGTTIYTYDDLNRLETVTEPSSEVVTRYTYDGAGNRETQTETLGATKNVTTYTYNDQNRLMSSVSEQRTYTDANTFSRVTTETVIYTYDNNGNQRKATKVPYVNGTSQTAQVTQCTYDKLNQLLTTSMPNGTVVSNTYNGEGLRVAKQVNGQTTKYVYISDKVVLELDGSGNQVARNVQGTSLIARTVGGTTLYYMYNGHADVTALLDANGTIQGTYYYDAFGNILESTGNVNNPFTYAGYQYDKETGLYLCNSRFYDPINARFLSEDTVNGDPNDPLSLNRYTYCVNNPIKYNDPTGHWPDFGGFFSGFSNFFSGFSNFFSGISSWGMSACNSASSWASDKVSSIKETASQLYNDNSNWIKPVGIAAAAVGSVALGAAILPEAAVAGTVAGVASTLVGNGLIAAGASLGITEINDFRDNGKFDTSFNQYLGSYVGGLAMGALAPLGGKLSPLANVAWMGASVMSGNVVEQYVSTGSVDYTQAALVGIGGAIGGTALTYGLKAGVPLVSKALGSLDDVMSGSFLSSKSAFSFGFDFGKSSLNFATDGFNFNYGNNILSGVKSDSWKTTQDSISKSMKALQDSVVKIKNEVADIGIGYKGAGKASLEESQVIKRFLPNGDVIHDITSLPGSKGINVPGRLTPQEMRFLTEEHGVEFALAYERGLGKNGAGGQYKLFSGTGNKVEVPINEDSMLIYHTHPGGSPWASNGDRKVLEMLQNAGSPQKSSQIIPIGSEGVTRFDIFGTPSQWPR